jgi:excisionase family DNA binding protein
MDTRESYFKVSELSRMLNVCEMTVRRYIRSGELKCDKVGKRSIRVSGSSLQAFLDKSRKSPTQINSGK